jgi:hypothetical protein
VEDEQNTGGIDAHFVRPFCRVFCAVTEKRVRLRFVIQDTLGNSLVLVRIHSECVILVGSTKSTLKSKKSYMCMTKFVHDIY